VSFGKSLLIIQFISVSRDLYFSTSSFQIVGAMHFQLDVFVSATCFLSFLSLKKFNLIIVFYKFHNSCMSPYW